MIATPVSAEEHFATKADLGELRAELKGEMGELRGELRHMATKADLAMLEARLTRWFVGLLVAMLGLFIAFVVNAVFTVLRFLG